MADDAKGFVGMKTVVVDVFDVADVRGKESWWWLAMSAGAWSWVGISTQDYLGLNTIADGLGGGVNTCAALRPHSPPRISHPPQEHPRHV